MTLDQLMAFTVSADHERQEQVYDRVRQSRYIEPNAIRRMLTEGAVRATDKRAAFIGVDAYVAAGGPVMNDLFQSDNGGWLQDVVLVGRLVAEKLEKEAEPVQAEGWKWVQVTPDLPYGYAYDLRRLHGTTEPLTPEEEAAKADLEAEYERLEQGNVGGDDLPEAVDMRLAEIETALAAYDNRPIKFDPDEIARAGAFVSIDGQGGLRVERGFVRPEDEPAIEFVPTPDPDGETGQTPASRVETNGEVVKSDPVDPEEPEDDGVLKPIPDRLMTELTTHRTLALRRALGEEPEVAFLVVLHAMCMKLFYRYAADSCLDLDLRSVSVGERGPHGLGDSELVRSLDRRHQQWATALPKEPQDLWEALTGFDLDSKAALFAHCVAASVNAVYDPYNRRPRTLAHADRLAEALDLDMAAAGWQATVDTYLGRVTKARILAAVREARGEDAARRLEGMKKDEMAKTAQSLLADTGWLPEPLRTPGRPFASAATSEPTIDRAAPGATLESRAADFSRPEPATGNTATTLTATTTRARPTPMALRRTRMPKRWPPPSRPRRPFR